MKKFFIIIFLYNINFASSTSKSYGLGIDIGSKGSGLFFNYIFGKSDKVNFLGEFRYFDIKGETEMYVYDYWSNQYSTISGQNLILLPILAGINYHPFAGKIANNFSPFITLRGGATLAIDGKEGNGSYRYKWGTAKTHWSPAWFIGAGIEFRWQNSTSILLHIGSDILELRKEADNNQSYSGMLIHIAFNKLIKK